MRGWQRLGDLQRNAEASPLTEEETGAPKCLLITPWQMSARPRQGACDFQVPAWCSVCPSQGSELASLQSKQSRARHQHHVLLRHALVCLVLVTQLSPLGTDPYGTHLHIFSAALRCGAVKMLSSHSSLGDFP